PIGLKRMKFRDIFGAEEAGIRRYSNDDKPKRAEIAPFERVRITLVTLAENQRFRFSRTAKPCDLADAQAAIQQKKLNSPTVS
ncbi:MAG: hypothetical protein IKQ18_09115, partial [Clostridia bacterium]|nr:hypothetical protein [Clostridia bacterium]